MHLHLLYTKEKRGSLPQLVLTKALAKPTTATSNVDPALKCIYYKQLHTPPRSRGWCIERVYIHTTQTSTLILFSTVVQKNCKVLISQKQDAANVFLSICLDYTILLYKSCWYESVCKISIIF